MDYPKNEEEARAHLASVGTEGSILTLFSLFSQFLPLIEEVIAHFRHQAPPTPAPEPPPAPTGGSS